jgi:hypothetical protein
MVMRKADQTTSKLRAAQGLRGRRGEPR